MRKLLSLFAVLLMSFGMLGGTTLAQTDLATTYCGDLADEDCTLLVAANEAMTEVTEASYNFDIAMDVTGEGETFAFDINMSGAYALDMSAAPDVDMTNIEMLTPAEMLDALETSMGVLDADLMLSVTLPEEAAEEGIPTDLTINSRFVDGTGYINMDDLANLTGGAFTGWHGMDMVRAFEDVGALLMGQMGEETMQQPLSALGFSMDDLGADTSQFAEIEALFEDNPGDFVMVQRLEDDVIAGNNVAVFQTDVDLAALFSDEEFQEYLRTQLAAQSEMGMPMTEEELDEAVQMQVALFADAQPMTITQSIGLDNSYIYNTSIDWTFDVPADMEAEAEGLESIMLDMSLGYDDFNNAPAIEAPADPTLHTVNELLGMFMGGGMGGGGMDG